MAMFKRRKLDAAVTGVISAIDPDDRVVAWATVSGDRYVVASVRGLWWPVAGEDEQAMRRIPWELIDKAVWRDGVLIVVEADLVDEYRFAVAPVAIGSGDGLFGGLEDELDLRLFSSIAFAGGAMGNVFRPANRA